MGLGEVREEMNIHAMCAMGRVQLRCIVLVAVAHRMHRIHRLLLMELWRSILMRMILIVAAMKISVQILVGDQCRHVLYMSK